MKNAAFLLLTACCCWAQASNDGNRLLHNCGEALRAYDTNHVINENTVEIGWCTGYVGGFTDGFDLRAEVESKTYAEYQTLHSMYICFPDHSTLEQDIRVLVKWLNDHPERLQENASTLVFSALRAAYPCTPKNAAGNK